MALNSARGQSGSAELPILLASGYAELPPHRGSTLLNWKAISPGAARGGREDGRSGAQARCVGGDAVHLEGRARRARRVRGQASEAARGREREA